MKTFPGIVRISVLTAIASVLILIIQACAPFGLSIENHLYALIIREAQQLKGSDADFEKALKKLKPLDVYDFHLVHLDGTFKDYHSRHSKVSIKTDRVITTELARSLSNDEFTPIGSNITHQLYTPYPQDIAIVLDQIKP
jgi:hypothetical protein